MEQKSQLQLMLVQTANRTNLQFKGILQGDPKLQREDTLKGILYIVDQYRQIISRVSVLSVQQKAKNYHVVYNTVSYITQITSYIQKSSFSFQSIKPLVDCILSIQSNLVLADIKYLDKRTQLYIMLVKIYEEAEYYQPAIMLLDGAIKKYEQLKKIYELDPPIEKYVTEILQNNMFLLKVMNIKFSIQGNVINANDWKKKTQEQLKDASPQRKLICLIECLRTQTKKNANIFGKNQKSFKQSLVQQGFDFIKPHLDILARGLKEMKQKIQFQITFKQKTITQTLKQEEINQQIKKKRQLIGKHIKQSQLKKASKSFPLQYHTQLIYYAYQVKNHKVLQQLLRCAMIRVECRRIEVPYVTDVKIQVSNTPHINSKQGYDKIPIDLNQANLKEQLKKLRKSGKTDPNAKGQINVVQQAIGGKDAKKGGKQAPPPPKQQLKQSDEPTEWQLQQINHKYVFMYVKRSYNPDKAIYDIKIVLGHQQKGPVGYQDCRRIIVPFIQKNQKVITSQIEQYKGIRQSTQMVPYIILSHSETSLQNEQQKKNLITDVEPIVGKNPMIPAKIGYTKLNMDLRQVPEQFIKMPGQSYIYLTYKNDYQFHLSSRLIQLFNSFGQLQNSYNTLQKQTNLSGEQIDKYSELSITYSLQKLDQFFSTFQDNLKGLLGQQFYLDKNDFLTNLVFQVWKKYLQQPLQQMDYIMEQRLNEEIIDHDYQLYKQIMNKCKPIFLKGLKVLNLVMINNKKCDILLLSKISLELIKMLQQSKEYYLASENARLAQDRIRMARDQYLSKSVESITDRLLPFSITCQNSTLNETIKKMKQKFLEQRLLIQKINKIRQLSNSEKGNISEQELIQAELQWKLNRVKDEFDQTVGKINSKHSEYSSLLASIDLDLSNIFFRVSLKHGEQLKKRGVNHTGHFSAGQLTGLADTLVKKLGFMETKSNMKEQKNLKQLQSTLIKAQKLPPPKPQASRPQKRLIQQSHKNPYKLALLLLNLGALNSDNQDKKYYLKQSLKALKQCKVLQGQLLKSSVQNSIFILSSMFDSEINLDKVSYKNKPFDDLYNGVWPCEGQRCNFPILVGKNSECIYLKLPPFVFKDKKHSKKITHMKLYGKVSANGVDVSTNCDELVGTGTKQPIGKIIRVSHLQPNNNYCFAVAPLNNATSQMMEIGKTSINIPTFNPLPISSIANSLAKVAYQIGEYDIAEEASRLVVAEYTQQSKILDQRTSNYSKSLKLKLNQFKIQTTSLLQIRAIAESIYVLSLCEKRKLQELRNSFTQNLIACQQKQGQILNLLNLCASLQPALPCPIASLSLATSQLSQKIGLNSPLAEGFMLSLLNKQYLSQKTRKYGISIIRKLMAWGLQNNEVSLVRRIVYKWASRKWVVLSKVIQIAAEQKKDAKKGGKDPKQAPQQQKMIDKFCHYMIQKSPLIMEQFQDSLATVSDDYSDMLTVYTEGVKQSIQELSQSTDNGQQKAEQILSALTGKIQLSQFMKDSINNIGKISNTSKSYLQYNCKLIRRALQVCPKSELKNLAQKIEDFQRGQFTDQIKTSLEIYSLIQQTFQNNIQFSPQSKNWIKFIMDKTQKKQLSKTIQIYEKYEQKANLLTKSLRSSSFSFAEKSKDYDNIHLWLSQLNHLKALALIMSLQGSNNKVLTVNYKIKPIYTALQSLNLQNLKKKQKQVEIMGIEKAEYDANTLIIVQKVFKYISQAMYSAFCVQNWIKFVNLVTVLLNFINFYEITPFYHQKNKCWAYLSMISYLLIEMLKKNRKFGSRTFKQRYSKKLQNTELQSIYKIMKPDIPLSELFEPLYDQYTQSYFIPELSNITSKQPWFTFKDFDFLNMSRLVELIVYTAQTLNLKQKNEIIIQILRQFSNVTDHSFSLELLPLLLDSQIFLSNQVQAQIESQENKMKTLDQEFQNQKKKHKKKRTAQITGQKMPFQIDYQINRKKIQETLDLLKQQRNFVNTQMQASNSIVQQIQRDCNKAALSQKQQKKYVQEFGEDEQNIWKNYQKKSQSNSLQRDGQQRMSINKMNILAKNRKNVLKDLISKYEQLYQKLRNNKTSKDTLSEILNRNEVGNLWYTLTDVQNQGDNINKAFQFWNDALATIFRKVNPIDNYLEIVEQNKNLMVQNIGFKQLLISLPIIYKISQFCCHKNLNLQRKTIQMSTQIVFKLFLTSLNHPQQFNAFSNYRLKSFDNGYQKILYHPEISVGQLTTSLEYFILQAYDIFDNSSIIKVLPLIILYEHIVVQIIKKKQHSFQAKIFKSLILSRCGQIKASTLNLMFVVQQKDLPILWLQKSDSLKKQKGQNWYPQTSFVTQNKPFYAPQNKQPIELIKNLNFPVNLSSEVNLQVPALFNIAKYSLLFKIYEIQIVQNFDINEQRINNLKQIQVQIRQALRKLSTIQEAQRLKQEYEQIKTKVQRGAHVEDQQKILDKKKTQIDSYMKSNGPFDDHQISSFLLRKHDPLRRVELIEHIIRTRFLVHKLNLSRNLSINSFYIIKNGLNNFNRYSYNARKVQTGYDPQIQSLGQSSSQATGKKDDKKGGKKQPQAIKAPVKQDIDPVEQERLKKESLTLLKRSSPNTFWHIKLTFQLGYLLFRQNNFVISLKIFQQVSKNSEIYSETYFRLFAQSYIERCRLRLGEFNKSKILDLISQIQASNFLDEQYVKLLMDFGQIFNKNMSVKLYEKGLQRSQKIWKKYGMRKYLQGLNQEPIKLRYAVTDQLTAEQQDMIKKKAKNKQQQKKPGGKQEKKAPKKDDGKKKKEQSKAQYKAHILKQNVAVNLFQEEEGNNASLFRQYTLQKHPNFYVLNIYNQFGKRFIKCFLKYWITYLTINSSQKALITQNSNNETASKQSYLLISKLLKIAETYPENNNQKLYLLKLKSLFEKQQFLYQLQENYLKGTLSKPQIKKIRLPYEDLPLNSRLNQVPSYFGFLTQNLKYLKSSSETFRQLITLIPQVSFILQNDQKLQNLVYEYANTVMLQLEYCGSLLPKYMKLRDQTSVVEDKKNKRKLLTSSFVKLLKYSIDLSVARKKLNEEYYSFSKKQLEATAKIDEDISMDIKNIDKQCKNIYPAFLKDSVKSKQSITSLDMLTYLLKIRRQAQVMTFSNPLENTLRKCHRTLTASLSTYKDNCLIPLPDLQKIVDNISANLTLVKSKRIQSKDLGTQIQSYIYILDKSESQDGIIYGKFNIEMNLLSRLLQNCYKVQSKLKQSVNLSQAVKQRNYKQLKAPFTDILKQIITFFGGIGPSSDPNLISNQILSKNIIKLSEKSISTLINLLNGEMNEESQQFNKFLKELHIIKYKLRQQKSTNSGSLMNETNEKNIEIVR